MRYERKISEHQKNKTVSYEMKYMGTKDEYLIVTDLQKIQIEGCSTIGSEDNGVEISINNVDFTLLEYRR